MATSNGQQAGVYAFCGHQYRFSPEQFNSSVWNLTAGFEVISVPTPIPHARYGPADPHLNEHAVDAFMEVLAKEITPRLPQPAVAKNN